MAYILSNIKFLLASIALLLFIHTHAYGQASSFIEGVVTLDQEPVIGATVEFVATHTGTTTDIEGKFALPFPPEGSTKLLIRYLGCKDLIIDPKDFPPNEPLQIAIESSSLNLDKIVVTGTMKSTFVSASPVKVDVITAKELDTYLPNASSSIVDGVQMINGVEEVVACGVCFTNSISINGLPGPYTAVLIDGTPMYGNLASVYGLNGIPNMIIDRYEVIKGPSSTLYGSEAVAGVINIITKDPTQQPLLSVDLMGTSHQESFGNLAIAPKFGKASGYIGLNYAYINNFDDQNKDGFGDIINLDRYSLFTKWNFKRKQDKLFTLSGKYYYEDRRNGVEAFLQDRAYRDLRGNDSIYGESIYTNRAELFGTYELPTSQLLKLDYSFSHHEQDSYYGADYYQATQQIGFANLTWRIPIKKHDILVGLTNRLQQYDDNTVATVDPDFQYIPGVFAQDEWTLNDEITILAGARLDHYEAHGLIFSPRFNLKYKPGNWTTIRGNFGTGFRIVNLFTEDHAFVTGQRTVEVVEVLRPEQSYNSTLNLNHIFTLGNSQGAIDIEGYYTYFTNKINPDYDTPGKIIYANSSGHAESMGLGVTINQAFSFPLTYRIGFNYQSVTETEPDESGVNQTNRIPFAPQWTGLFNMSYRWKKPNITFGYTVRATGPMELPEVFDLDEQGTPLPNARPTQSDFFAIQNIQITKVFSNTWTVYGGIQNLGNYRQAASPLVGFNDPNSAAGFSDLFDTAYAYSPIHGSELFLGVKWTFDQ